MCRWHAPGRLHLTLHQKKCLEFGADFTDATGGTPSRVFSFFFLTPLFNLSLAMSFHVICIRPRRPLNADGTTTAGDHRLLGAYLMNKTTVFWRFQVISYQVLGLKLLWLLCTSCLAQTLLSICPDLSKCFVPLRAAVLMCVATQIKVCL